MYFLIFQIKKTNKWVPAELWFLCRLQGISGVIEILEWYYESRGFLIVTKYDKEYVDLRKLLVDKHPKMMTESICKRVFLNILKATKRLKDAGVYHGDLKTHNILYNVKTHEIKIIDFGLSTEYSDTREIRLGKFLIYFIICCIQSNIPYSTLFWMMKNIHTVLEVRRELQNKKHWMHPLL